MVQIDLRAAVISADTRVWRLFPGAGYKFLDQFKEQNLAFLDLPGLVLPKGSLDDSEELLPRIIASQKVIEAKRDNGPDADVSIDWTKFRSARKTKTRGRYRAAVVNFFEKAKAGDLLVVPSSLSTGTIRIGRFRDKPKIRRLARYKEKYGKTRIPARRIEWLKTVPEHQVSASLSASLRTQHAFSLIERSHFLEVLSFAFDSLIFGDMHSASIYNTKDDYTDNDTALITLISRISASVCQEIDQSDDGKGELPSSLLDKILLPAAIEYSCSHSSDIHSAGFNRLSSAMITPLVVVAVLGALMSLGHCESADALEVAKSQIEIFNTLGGTSDPCTPRVSKAAMKVLDVFDVDQLLQKCKDALDARERAGLEPGVSIVGPVEPLLDDE